MFRIVVLFLLLAFCFCGFAFSQTASGEREQIGNARLEIILKPQAPYTEKARKKKISGIVFLEVTFLASGEIGDVVYLRETSEKKKLSKYGLTAAAIAAAKKIQFKPAIENGKPITIVKTVIYEFTIYDK